MGSSHANLRSEYGYCLTLLAKKYASMVFLKHVLKLHFINIVSIITRILQTNLSTAACTE